jgi:hypothetical protein
MVTRDRLFIVVRHPAAQNQSWTNDWPDNNTTLRSITTTPLVREQCLNADVIYVHRGSLSRKGQSYEPPRICCSVRVKSVKGTETKPVVEFDLIDILDWPVPKRLYYGLRSYYSKLPIGV